MLHNPAPYIRLPNLVGPLVDTAYNFYIGVTIETVSAVVTSTAGTVTLTVEKSGGGDLTMLFSNGPVTFSGPATIELTLGSDIAPQINYIYITKAAPTVLSKSTSYFPTAEEFVPVGQFLVESAATVATYGTYKTHLYTDHIWKDTTEDGHLHMINAWIRTQPSTWSSGTLCTPTLDTAPSPDTLTIAVASGKVLQLHLHGFPAFDSSGGGTTNLTTFFMPNHTTAYTTGKDLYDFRLDSSGNGAANNDRVIWVVWGVISEETGDCKIFVNLPSDFYNSDAAAITDGAQYGTYAIPSVYTGTGFLIAKLVYKYLSAGGGSLTLVENRDLRGSFPSTVAGGAGTALTVFPDNVFAIQNVADSTKEIKLDASGITAGNTRTITMPNQDIDLTPGTGSFATEAEGTLASAALPKSGGEMSGNITMVGAQTVDGRDLSADGSKLDGIESGATADQSNTEIRNAVEAATNSNTFNDTDHSKLNALVSNATHTGEVTGATSLTIANDAVTYAKMQNVVADERLLGNVAGAGAIVAELDQSTVLTFLGVEAGATADQTNSEIRDAVEAATNSNTFNDTDHSKLNGIEATADITDTANVTAALPVADSTSLVTFGTAKEMRIDVGAVADSTVRVLTMPNQNIDLTPGTGSFATEAEGTLATNALPKGGGQMSGNITMSGAQTVDGRDLSADGSKLDGIESSADITDATNVTAAGALMKSIGGTVAADVVVDGNLTAGSTAGNHEFTVKAVSNSTTGGRIILEGAAAFDDHTLQLLSNNLFIETTSANDNVLALLNRGAGTYSLSVAGDITLDGTVDGRDVATDGATLDGLSSPFPTADSTSLVTFGTDKEMRIDVGAVSDSTVRVLTMPNQDIDLSSSGTFLYRAGGAMTGALTMGGTAPTINVGSSAISTQTAKIEIGTGRTGNGASYIDLVGDTTYTSYGLRLIRGASGVSQLEHRGTGTFTIFTAEAANMVLATDGTTRLTINGSTGISTFTSGVTMGATGSGQIITLSSRNSTNLGGAMIFEGAGSNDGHTFQSVDNEFRFNTDSTNDNVLRLQNIGTGDYSLIVEGDISGRKLTSTYTHSLSTTAQALTIVVHKENNEASLNVGIQLKSYTEFTSNGIFGAAIEAWAGGQIGALVGGNNSPLIAIEPACISEIHNHPVTAKKFGVNAVFKDRFDANTAVRHGSIGSNLYNRNSHAYRLDAGPHNAFNGGTGGTDAENRRDGRGTDGEYCGWWKGLSFAPAALDFIDDGAGSPISPVGIDFAEIGGSTDTEGVAAAMQVFAFNTNMETTVGAMDYVLVHVRAPTDVVGGIEAGTDKYIALVDVSKEVVVKELEYTWTQEQHFPIVDATTQYEISGTKVVSARVTGWSSPSGTHSGATFDTATVTTEELAKRVHSLIDACIAHGLIGT